MRATTVVLAGAALLSAPLAQADEKKTLESISMGRAVYLVSCASCHGSDGKGTVQSLGARSDGKAVAVPDLATIESRDGTFSPLHVARHIEGSDRGWAEPCTAGMPCWQHILGETRGSATARMQILNLVNYLRSIQESPAK